MNFNRLYIVDTSKPITGEVENTMSCLKEHGAPDDAVCAGQSVDGAPADPGSAGMSAPTLRQMAAQGPANGSVQRSERSIQARATASRN